MDERSAANEGNVQGRVKGGGGTRTYAVGWMPRALAKPSSRATSHSSTMQKEKTQTMSRTAAQRKATKKR